MRILERVFGRGNQRRRHHKGKPSRRPASRRLSFDALEDRCMPAALTVTSPLDDGSAGTLRYCINQANADPARDIITFDQGLAGQTITLARGPLLITQS